MLEKIKAVSGVEQGNFESLYAYDLKGALEIKDVLAAMRLQAELNWYRERRPYFNVYPLIEKKLLELNDSINASELHLPFKTIEVRTQKRTILLGDTGTYFICVHEMPNGRYEEFAMSKSGTLSEIANGSFQRVNSTWPKTDTGPSGLDKDDRTECLFLAAGTCLLARDTSIVCPVILNNHRRDNMTPAEIAEYAAKAVARSGRVGFDVGRDIERMKASAHYRNGHFAKFHVTSNHPMYPPNATAHKVPIIQWRSGAVVNKDVVPTVPTGFKDEAGV